MPHDTLDERLRRYYDEIPTLDVPLDHAAPMARARQRRRHQLTGLVAATVLMIAGLGAYARTLLDHEQHSSGPVAVEGDDPDGAPTTTITTDPDPTDAPDEDGIGLGLQYTLPLPPRPSPDVSALVRTARTTAQGIVADVAWWDTSGGVVDRDLWLFSGGWTRLDPPLSQVTGFTVIDDEVIVAVGRSPGGPALVRSDDGGATWQSRTLPLTEPEGLAHGTGFFATRVDGRVVTLDADDLHELARVDLDEPSRQTSTSTELREVDGEVWILDRGQLDGFESLPPPTRILTTSDGTNWSELDLPGDGRWHVTSLHGDPIRVSGPDDGSIHGPGDVVLDVGDLAEWDAEGPYQQMNVYDLRAGQRGAALLGSFARGFDDQVLWMLASPDGRRWSRIDLPLPPGLRSAGTAVQLLDVDHAGTVLVDLGTYGSDGAAVPLILVVEPEGSDSTTTRARAAADAFVAAWRDGDRQAMFELVDDASVVDNALAIAGPSGEITRCSSQVNGQFECFVDTTETYEAYIQVGPPGAPDGVVSWVGPVAD